MSKTTYLGLEKPAESEFYRIQHFNDNADIIDEKVHELENKVGSPFIAQTAAQMTDKTRVYVYVGSESGYTKGNWYYHNGSKWISGGVYNSQGVDTDKNLDVEGKAADAKATGDRLSSITEDMANLNLNQKVDSEDGIYVVGPNGNTSHSEGSSATDYIPLILGVTYSFKNLNLIASRGLCVYDKNKKFLSMLAGNSDEKEYEFTVNNDDYAFVRATGKANDYVYYKIKYDILSAVSKNATTITDLNLLAQKMYKAILQNESIIENIRKFKLGLRHNGNPDETSLNTVVSKEAYIIYPGDVILVKNGYKALYIDENGKYVGFFSSNRVVLEEKKVWFEVRLDDESNIKDASIIDDVVAIRRKTILDDIPKKVYVDSSLGSDNNKGDLKKPYQTIQKGIDSGANIIYVKPGDYQENVRINRDNICILPLLTSKFDSSIPNTPMIHINGGEEKNVKNGLTIYNCSNITVEGVWCDNTKESAAYVAYVDNIQMNRCFFSNAKEPESMGLQLYNTNGVFRDCLAYDVAKDGFNIHGYGNTQFINCSAHDCGDDGISHHDGCTGFIYGGEWYNCAKGGISSPTYGANINISNCYSHDNAYGLYSVSNATTSPSKTIISNCVFVNNTAADILSGGIDNDVTIFNCVYNKKSVNNTAKITDLNDLK